MESTKVRPASLGDKDAISSSRASSPAPRVDDVRTDSGSVPLDVMAAPVQDDDTPEGERTTEDVYITGMKLAVVLINVTLVVFLLLLDTSIIVTAIPSITSDFHSLNDVGWYGSSYLLASCALQPLTGKIYTYFSSKWSYLGFVVLFEFGSLICGLASSSNMLIVGRAIAGMGASGLFNGGLTILTSSLPLVKRPLYLGMMMSIAQLGVLFGPLIGGALTQYTTWRWCFYINLPIGAVAIIFLSLITVPDHRVTTDLPWYKIILTKLDLIGFALFAPAIVMFLLALQWGGSKFAWGSATVIGLFCGAAGNFAVFLYWEYRMGEGAMIPLSMLKIRVVWASSAVIFFFFGAMLMATYYLPIYFQTVRDASPTLSGVYLLPSIISMMIGAGFSGALVARVGYYLPFVVTSAVLVGISSGLISTFTPSTSTGIWIGYQIILGFGRGISMQMPIVAVQNVLPPKQGPVALAILIFFQTFGGSLWLSFAQTTFSEELKKALAQFAPEVDAKAVIAAGATAVRQVVSGESLDHVILAYNQAIKSVFYLCVGCSSAYFVLGFLMGWKSIKKAAKKDEPASEIPAMDEPKSAA